MGWRLNGMFRNEKDEELSDEEMNYLVKKAVRMAIQKQEEMGIPIVRYDPKSECLYIMHEDGSRSIVKENVKHYFNCIKENCKGDD